MAFISYTERPISALSSIGEARARLIWVDFNFVMSQQPPIRWSLNSWAAQANHGHPNVQEHAHGLDHSQGGGAPTRQKGHLVPQDGRVRNHRGRPYR